MIELEAAFQPVYGTHMTTEVILWQRVVNTKAVMWMLGHDLPPEASAPGTWLHDALEVRDRWESRLLRSAAVVAAVLRTVDGDESGDPDAFDLARTFVHLGRVPPRPRFPTSTWSAAHVEAYRRRFAADGKEGRLVCVIAQDATWDSWERHPAGEEVVVLLSGRVDLVQELDGADHVVELRPGEAMVNPANVWHTARVHEPGRRSSSRPATGTEHRPLRLSRQRTGARSCGPWGG